MTDRLEILEERVSSLATAVAALEARLASFEGGAALPAPGAAAPMGGAGPVEEPAGDLPDLTGAAPAALAGRALLGIGGAYLFRALTEAGSLPHLAGAALGLAYAAAWAWAADRSGRAGRTADATLHGFLSLLVALPLLWEATVRMQALTPSAAAALLAAIGATVFAVGWRNDLASLAWGATLGSVGTAWGLLLATNRLELYSVLLIAFGAATLWATYGRRWHGLRWPAALAADLAVATLAFLAGRPGGPPEAWTGLSPTRGALVALLLFVVYAGSFALRTLARRRDVNVFEVFQTAAVLLCGYGGAVRLAHAAGTGERALGVAALVLAALAYAAAFGFLEREASGARNFVFFSSLALVLALTGGGLLASGSLLALVWSAFGVLGAALGSRFGRRSLEAHGAAYVLAAAVPAGLPGALLGAFGAAPGGEPAAIGRAAAGLALLAAIAFVLVVRARDAKALPFSARIAPFLLLVVAAAGAGAGTVALLARVLPAAAWGTAPTVVLALSAVVLAAIRARAGVGEAGVLAWLALAAAGLRILVRDLPAGRPAALFAAFVVCGLSLLAVSRLAREGEPKP